MVIAEELDLDLAGLDLRLLDLELIDLRPGRSGAQHRPEACTDPQRARHAASAAAPSQPWLGLHPAHRALPSHPPPARAANYLMDSLAMRKSPHAQVA